MKSIFKRYRTNIQITTLWAIIAIVNNTNLANEIDDLAEQLTVSGAIEVEATYTDSVEWGDSNSTSDLLLVTAQLGFEFVIADNISMNMVTLYKEGEVDFDIHEGFLQMVKLGGKEISLSIGKMYLPFGQLETNLVNDTLALEMVSPDQSIGFRETAIIFNWKTGKFNLKSYVFNGDVDAEDKLSDWGFSFNYKNKILTFATDYLNNIADSAMICNALMESQMITPEDNLSAVSINAAIELGDTTLLVEHIQSAKLNNIGFQTAAVPSVSQVDLGYDLDNGWNLAIAYQITNDAIELGIPKSRLTAGFSTNFFNEGLSLSTEYWHDRDYDVVNGGTGEKFNGFVIQLASEF
ncbi:MAG: LbtU family siderophore porin [Gammaproteobacteria bacterium]|nr:LbtU family siderophore porin [Gammaproteobacteria bacterium]